MHPSFIVVSSILLGACVAHAQEYPAKPIRFILPLAPGGGGDILARAIAQKLNEKWGQPVIVDNRPGGGGVIGTDAVAKAPPDGYTILMIATNHTVNPSLIPKLPYDAISDFAPVTQLTASPNVLALHPSLPASSLKELIALARQRPGQLNYSSAGNGTAGHLAAELLKVMAGVDVVHVPYKAAPQALSDLISGQVQLQFSNLMAALPHIKSARLRGIAVTTLVRSPALPQLPTMNEAGLRDYRVDQTYGVVAPGRTPAAVVAKLNSEIVGILRTPEIGQRMADEGAMLIGNSPQEYLDYLRTELQKWRKVVTQVGIRLD